MAKKTTDLRAEFADGTMEALELTVNGQSVPALPREFSTGSFGWNINAPQVMVEVNGKKMVCRFSGNIIVSGSKDK